MSEKLLCNIRNVRRPIMGLIQGKRITKDELGIELALRQFMTIKKDCNIYGVINGEEYIIPTGDRFKELLKMQNTLKSVKDSVVERTKENISESPKPVEIANTDVVVNAVDIRVVSEEPERFGISKPNIYTEPSEINEKDQGIDYTEEELEAINEVTDNSNNSNRKNKNKRRH